jgi:fibronectin type 3 domain-containing protein
LQTGPKASLTWQDKATNESGFVVERSTDNGVTFSQVGTAPARNKTGTVTFVDGTVALGSTYQYRVSAVNAAGRSTTPPITVQVSAPSVPAGLGGTATRIGSSERMTMTWSGVSNASSYAVRWSSTSAFTTVAGTSPTIPAGTLTYTTGNVARQVWYMEVRATNVLGSSAWSSPVQVAAAP